MLGPEPKLLGREAELAASHGAPPPLTPTQPGASDAAEATVSVSL